MNPTCVICDEPTDGTVCRRDTATLAGYLRGVIDVAGDVETSVARLARYGVRGGRAGIPDEQEGWGDDGERFRLPLLAHGWVARLDRPKRGALIETPLPYHPGMATRAAAAINTITTWARHVCEERGIGVPLPGPMLGPLCRAGWGCNHPTCDLIRARTIDHPAARAARFLLTQLEWIRHRPEAADVVDEVSAAAATLRRCVDAPPKLTYAGPCWELIDGDERCEVELYAVEDAPTVRCIGCGTAHDMDQRRRWLLGEAQDALANAATIAAGLSSLNQQVTSSMIRNYADRGRIVAHGRDRDGRPLYRVGDVLDVLVDIATRKKGQAA